jgi:hypothetical protein
MLRHGAGRHCPLKDNLFDALDVGVGAVLTTIDIGHCF